jgi:hypothetical protein
LHYIMYSVTDRYGRLWALTDGLAGLRTAIATR